MIYCPDSAYTLPLHVRQAVADQQHSPRRIAQDSPAIDVGDDPWAWIIENWSEEDWKEFALASQWEAE